MVAVGAKLMSQATSEDELDTIVAELGAVMPTEDKARRLRTIADACVSLTSETVLLFPSPSDMTRTLGYAMCASGLEIIRASRNEVEEVLSRALDRLMELFMIQLTSATFHFSAAFYGASDLLPHLIGVTGIHDVEHANRHGPQTDQELLEDAEAQTDPQVAWYKSGEWYRDQLRAGLFGNIISSSGASITIDGCTVTTSDA